MPSKPTIGGNPPPATKKKPKSDDRGLASLLGAARKALRGMPRQKSSLADLCDSMATQFYGMDGIVRRLKRDYLAHPPGSPQRLRIQELMLRAMIASGVANKGNDRSEDDMDDDELDAEIDAILHGAGLADPGDPNTPEGVELADAVLDDEEIELSADIARLEAAEEIDELAAAINRQASVSGGEESQIPPGYTPDEWAAAQAAAQDDMVD